MNPLFDAPLAIVDVETTGAHPAWDRVTEVAVVEVAGGEVVSEWSTLVNPGTRIPPAIQALTGITDAMVADAPAFEALAPGLYERLDGRVFVAHNARFDYGFLRHEFERAGLRFQARTLCTVKLSRRLYPGHARHNLDSLIDRHRLKCSARHRALGDAQAVWQFLRVAAEERGGDELENAARQLAQLPALPAHLERAAVDAVPESPGVYLFYGENDTPLYVGKSVAMRSRVLQHFAADVHSPREAQIAREIRRIEWRRSCGELGALLLEAQLVKELLPVFNRQLRRANDLTAFALDGKDIRLVSAEQINSETLPFLCGVFRSKRAAMDALRGIADEHRLCLRTLGFESGGKGACFRHQIRRCGGVCAGRESAQAHLARAAAALAGLKTAAWPWRGPIGIVEEDRERESVEVHVVDNWCLLGSVRSEPEVAELLEGAPRPRFDLDHYRILSRHLAKGRARVVEFGARPH
ncbi:MAG TPA: exonuclease domain-containing protein [Burkholderiales bacterium]|nr:exonuclease domain-containing protein [Burkholderiales bacterium]